MADVKLDPVELRELLLNRDPELPDMMLMKYLHDHAEEIADAVEKQERLRATVRRLMIEWPGEPMSDQPHVPQHACGYFIGKASCEFHEWWADAAVACGLMDEWAEEAV